MPGEVKSLREPGEFAESRVSLKRALIPGNNLCGGGGSPSHHLVDTIRLPVISYKHHTDLMVRAD